VVIATFQLSLAGLALLPLALFGPHPTALHWQSVAAVTVLGVLGSGLAYLLFFRLLATISPTRTVAVTYLLPIWGLFWGFVAGEEIRWTALAGVAVVLTGLVLLNLPPNRSPRDADPASRNFRSRNRAPPKRMKSETRKRGLSGPSRLMKTHSLLEG
jgi:drug/metabolite transporter (DMT)-like permease